MNSLRPFYFIVVVWGKQFCDYLTDYCIPSLLSPNNIPKLINNNKNRFLICTSKEDWEKLQIHPTTIKLKQYIEPFFIEIPLPAENVSSCQHMGIGHKLATDICFQEKAYGIALTPDLMVSDGTLTNIQKHALEGKHLVLCAAIRFAEEPFFAGLEQQGIKSQLTMQTELTASSRQLVKLCLKSFHSETETYDFDSQNYGEKKAVALWRLPKEQGLLIHSLSWCPMLIDYAAMQAHDTTALEKWTMDGDYLHKNIHDHEKIYICQDSDEIMIVSWSPLNYSKLPLKPNYRSDFVKKIYKFKNRLLLAQTLRNPIFDPLKLKLFPLSIRWHTEDINKEWMDFEQDIKRILFAEPNIFFILCFSYISFSFYYMKVIAKYAVMTFFACIGNKNAQSKLKHRINLFKKERG